MIWKKENTWMWLSLKLLTQQWVMASQVLRNKLVVFPTCLFLNLARITSAKTGKNHWIYKEYNEIDTNACIYIESLLTESCKFGESKILPKCNRTGNEYLTIILIVILNKLKTLWRLLA